jgi:hypothetical protein
VSWFYLLLFVGAGVAVVRIYGAVRRIRAERADDWDERLVKNLRAQGGDAFRPYEVDFFFGFENEAGCAPLAAVLQAEGFKVDFHAAGTEGASGYTLCARKDIRVSIPVMQEYSARFRKLATEHLASYDGWATEGVTKAAEAQPQRPRWR